MAQDRNEPSLEEILASIKKVISEDGRDRMARRPAATAEPAASSEDDVLELTETLEDVAGPALDQRPERLISENREQSMRDSLALLATLAEPGAAPQVVRSGETSLEAMVRELMRPMLSAWLEKNLPIIVEQMVAREINRITGRKG